MNDGITLALPAFLSAIIAPKQSNHNPLTDT